MIAPNRQLDIGKVPSSELDIRTIESFAGLPLKELSRYAVFRLGLESRTVSEILRAVGVDEFMPREEINLQQFYGAASRMMEANARRQIYYDN